MRLAATLIFGCALMGLVSLTSRAQPALELPVESKSISIAEAVAMALQNHPRIAMRAAEASAAQARIGMARSMTKPQLSTTTFATTGTMPSIVPGPPDVEPQANIIVADKRQVDLNLMAMFPLYTGGRLGAQVKSVGYQYQAAVSDVSTSRLDTALETKTAYRRALLAGRFVDAYQKRVDEATERARIAQVSFDEGKIAKFDLLRNQTELAEAQQALVNAKKDVAVAMVDLKAALGVSQASQLTLSDQLSSRSAEGTLQDAEAQALRQRPEIASVRARMQSARSNVDVVRGAYRPAVYLVGMQDFTSVSGEGSDNGYTVGVAAAIPLVDGGRRKSAANESRAMLERIQAEEREIVLAVSRDVGTAWAEAEAAAKNVGLSQAAVDQAEEDYRVITLRYEAGKATNVEVLDALASLTRAQTNYAQALYDCNIAQDRLERATGTATLPHPASAPPAPREKAPMAGDSAAPILPAGKITTVEPGEVASVRRQPVVMVASLQPFSALSRVSTSINYSPSSGYGQISEPEASAGHECPAAPKLIARVPAPTAAQVEVAAMKPVVEPAVAIPTPAVIAKPEEPRPAARVTLPTSPARSSRPALASALAPTGNKRFPAVAAIQPPIPVERIQPAPGKPLAPALAPKVVKSATALSAVSRKHVPGQKAPLRDVLRRLGMRVHFVGESDVIVGTNPSMTVEFQVGASEALINDRVVILSAPIAKRNGRAVGPATLTREMTELEVRS